LVVSEKGIFQINTEFDKFSIQPLFVENSIFQNAVKIMVDDDGLYAWIATEDKGLYIYDIIKNKILKNLKSFYKNDNLLSNSVNYFFNNHKGTYFIGTARGIAVYNSDNNLINNYDNYFSRLSDFGHPIYAIKELENGIILLGTKKKGAYFFNSKNYSLNHISVFSFNKKLNNPVFYCFNKIFKNSIIAGTSNGIFQIHKNNLNASFNRILAHPELNYFDSTKITAIEFQSEEVCWLGTMNDGLYKWFIKEKKVVQYKRLEQLSDQVPVDNQIQKIVKSKKFWIICTKYGFSILDLKTCSFRNFLPGNYYPKDLPARNIKDAYCEGENIWLATFGAGLVKYDLNNKIFHAYTTIEGFSNNELYSVLPDNRGKLYSGTNNGLTVFDPSLGKIQIYKIQNGLPDNEFNGFSATKSEFGTLHFSTLNGMFSVYPEYLISPNFHPDIHLTYFSISNGKDESLINVFSENSYLLPSGYNSLYLKFSPFVFTNSDIIHYRIKLLEYTNHWITLKEPVIRFTNLPPGNYTLIIETSLDGLNWTKNSFKTTIKLKPFWYQTFWFKVLFYVIIFGLIIVLIRFYTLIVINKKERVYERDLAIQQERHRISNEIHDEIGADLSALKLMTEILIKSNDLEYRSIKLLHMHKSIKELINKLREVIWSLNDQMDNVEDLYLYIRNQCLDIMKDTNIKVIINMQEIKKNIYLTGKKRRNIYLIIKESLHNIIKHSKADMCTLDFRIENNNLLFSIYDNGIGFDLNKIVGNTNGIKSIQFRIKNLNGSLQIKSHLGTTLSYKIPLYEY
jgi:signal transduction histidine kinase